MRPRHDPRRSFRPLLEALEARALLSVCTVDRLGDLDDGKDGRGDLRYCVIESLFRADTINFEVTGVINLTRGLPNLTRSVSIEGLGADRMTIRRNTGGAYRIFTVAIGATVSISGLTITNGISNGGGGILNSGTLTISDSTISGNTGGGGGGVLNSGTVTVSNSTISGNSGGSGIDNTNGTLTISSSTISGNSGGNGGGISNNGRLTVSNSTISGNSAGGGGGIFHRGTLTVSNSTISGNSAGGDGGGIYVAGTMSARNTIIAGNMAPAGPDVFGNLGSQGYNLLGNPQDASGWVETDILHVNPRLGPLQDNGGPTRTHALLPGSPAIDAGFPTRRPKWDQRGVGFPRIAGANIDIGAFEVQGRNPMPGDGTHPDLPRFDVAALLTLQLSQDTRPRPWTGHGLPSA